MKYSLSRNAFSRPLRTYKYHGLVSGGRQLNDRLTWPLPVEKKFAFWERACLSDPLLCRNRSWLIPVHFLAELLPTGTSHSSSNWKKTARQEAKAIKKSIRGTIQKSSSVCTYTGKKNEAALSLLEREITPSPRLQYTLRLTELTRPDHQRFTIDI